jgi:hypothetical protein
MRKHHLIIMALAFLTCLVSIFFGIKIFNANENYLITELNEVDKLYYSDVADVPALSYYAAMITLPFLLGMLIFEIVIFKKAAMKKVKNIAVSLMIALLIILVVDVLTLSNSVFFDFSQWGFVWICLGLLVLAGNGISFVMRTGEKV